METEINTDTTIITETVVPALRQPQSPDGMVISDPFSPTSPTSPTLLVSPTDPTVEHVGLHGEKMTGTGDETGSAPISVEEAVQNVSLH